MIIIPHFDPDLGWHTRTTEACSAAECEEKAFHYRTQLEQLERGEIKVIKSKSTFSSVRGTVGHHKVQNWIERRMGLPDTPMRLRPNDQALYNKIMTNPKLKKKFDNQVANSFMNFIGWWEKYQPQPLLVEQSMFYIVKGRKLKGTVDFVCLIKESKLDKTLKVPVRTEKWRLVIIDWKTGTRVREEHKTQISAYYHAAHQKILIPFLRRNEYYNHNGKPYGIDVYLGGKAAKTTMFDIDEYRFFVTVELYNKAEQTPVDRLNGGILHGSLHDGAGACYFCPFTDRCSTIIYSEMTVNELKEASAYDTGPSLTTLPQQS